MKKKNFVTIIVLILIGASLIATTFLLNAINSDRNYIPEEDNDEWVLVVDGLVSSPLTLTYNDLLEMPSKTVRARLWCVDDPTGVSASTHDWTGVPLKDILETAGISDNAVKIAFYAADAYSTDLTPETALRDDIIIALQRDGKFIDKKQEGYPPTQLVVPGKYGYKWAKYLIHIEVVDYDFLGYYESRGYSDEADFRSS
ncbi:molybdopterin-dependent oxidoreductase [Candidatus Borrarchaeum sp.]|uniref:molybdopterin-dependent oxidoreductase n=1 Tax=Candidatus Borrarchaeum sp. TaxID=2846742 RepID=UPI00257DD526|nr:molybdopterin-dependent oxidoreductase [Candidatus Borrarchaeum sp.]